MSKIYEKYRDLITNPFDIKYKNIEIINSFKVADYEKN